MYELSVAAKYLTPRWRQLSVSIISIISILVIAVVVWLIVVFFSVTNGLTNNWIEKLIALTSPVRITPTKEYYQSYYYLVDSISQDSNYGLKTVGEKFASTQSDPYNPNLDEEPPISWQKPDLQSDGSLTDPVKLAFAAINDIKGVQGLSATDYEMTVSNLRLRTLRTENKRSKRPSKDQQQGFLSQASYVGSMDPINPWLSKAVVSVTVSDLSNLLANLSYQTNSNQEDNPDKLQLADKSVVQDRLRAFFDHVEVEKLKTPDSGWRLPRTILPKEALWDVAIVKRGNLIQQFLIPMKSERLMALFTPLQAQGFTVFPGKLKFSNDQISVILPDGSESPLPQAAQLFLEGGIVIPAQLEKSSLATATEASTLKFHTQFSVQGVELSGEIPYGTLRIAQAGKQSRFEQAPIRSPYWIYSVRKNQETEELSLPSIPELGDGILLPKGFRESGAMIGDAGYLSYFTPTASSVQEQRIPVFVAGFYDPGIIPIGGKYVLANKQITTLIRASHNQEDTSLSNGINVRFADRNQADHVKAQLQKTFKEAGIDSYWKVETYREFEFTKDIIQQLQSEKRLFTLLATLIIIVACSNIISMLIILVNDKKIEIGILRSMGATSASIAAIFGICGVVMGVLGSLLGTLAAILTLKNIQAIVDFISRVQGYEMFNPVFYGESLPTDISFEALSFVVIATAIISLIAGIVPAIKASLLRPSVILKAE